jgi:predicted ester cyclase
MFDPQTTMDRASCESIARNKELARQWFHHISTGNLDGLRAMTSENWVMVGGPPDLPSGHEGIRMLFEHIGDIDQTWTIEDIIAENDKVVVRATNTCVQESFFGVPGAGITQVFSATFILHFADGLVINTWRNAADLQRLFQLGARILPPEHTDPQATARAE